ncbi:MAG: hypothetical protein QM645_13980 [Asticcacaulis sp.]
MSKIFLAALCLFSLSACNAQPPTKADVAGKWTYDSRGDGDQNPKEVSSGQIQFRGDGTFEANNVSGIVLKINDPDTHDGKGIWSIRDRGNIVARFLERPAVTLTYEEHGIPYDARYSEYHDEKLLTFSRDEEAGEWVKYKKAK